jgi:hypothetical protein
MVAVPITPLIVQVEGMMKPIERGQGYWYHVIHALETPIFGRFRRVMMLLNNLHVAKVQQGDTGFGTIHQG